MSLIEWIFVCCGCIIVSGLIYVGITVLYPFLKQIIVTFLLYRFVNRVSEKVRKLLHGAHVAIQETYQNTSDENENTFGSIWKKFSDTIMTSKISGLYTDDMFKSIHATCLDVGIIRSWIIIHKMQKFIDCEVGYIFCKFLMDNNMVSVQKKEVIFHAECDKIAANKTDEHA